MPEYDYDRKVESLREDVNELKVLLKEMADKLKEAAMRHDGGIKNLRRGLDEGVEWVRGAVETARERGHKAVEDVTERVEHRPVVSVLAAFAVGILVGGIVRGHHR